MKPPEHSRAYEIARDILRVDLRIIDARLNDAIDSWDSIRLLERDASRKVDELKRIRNDILKCAKEIGMEDES